MMTGLNGVVVGSWMAAIGVILGAFGTHGLRGKVDDEFLRIFETGTHYLMLHAFACLFYGLWYQAQAAYRQPKPWPLHLFVAGTFIFSGSLYALVFSGVRMFGAITPIGGLCLIIGWISFAFQASRKERN